VSATIAKKARKRNRKRARKRNHRLLQQRRRRILHRILNLQQPERDEPMITTANTTNWPIASRMYSLAALVLCTCGRARRA